MNDEIKAMERALMQDHPNWPAGKAKWVAMQALGLIKR